ncbi:hypothetical protein GP486_003418 [Trichoglossum hirsutum]|uniref:Uncharacterized protein n=1 Tax=Trichoglossum hirsutum TaxID=265104 RepID=A0A9P8LCM6_9PEZI|nr:hypothetical protein GP486_003418 [Trichoglossum hirsutum]
MPLPPQCRLVSPGAQHTDNTYSLPQALVGLKKWTEPDVMFERDILLGPDDDRALELAGNIRKQLVDTYKLLHPLMEVRERHAFGDRSFFVENDEVGDGYENELSEDSEYSVQSVTFSHDSAWLASASGDRTVKIWDASSDECLQTLSVGKKPSNMSTDTSGLYLHTGIGTVTVAIDASRASSMTPSVKDPRNSQYKGWGLSSDGEWITHDSENFV